MGRLDGKLALVTGAASGIGRAISVRFAAEGAAVAIADISGLAPARETLARVRAVGGSGMVVIGDVADVHDAHRIVDEAAAGLGGLDIVVNNAGYYLPPQRAADYSVDAFDRIIAVNLRGPFLIAKFAIPHLLSRGGGVVLGIGSVNGVAVCPGDCAYNASKAGHHMLAQTIAIDYAGDGIRSNCILPAAIETEGFEKLSRADDDPQRYRESTVALHPIGRLGRPEEIASMAVALCSDEASFVTGALVQVDGGYLAV